MFPHNKLATLAVWLVLIPTAVSWAQSKPNPPPAPSPESLAEAEKFRQLGVECRKQEKHHEALDHFTRSLNYALNPNVLCERAMMHVVLEDHATAIQDLNQAVQLDPRLALAFQLRGVCHEELGDINRSIGDFTTAIDLDPTLAEPYVLRAVIWTKLDQYQLVIPDCQAALRLDSELFIVHVLLAGSYQNLNRQLEAEPHWNKAIELEPNRVDLYLARGKALNEAKEFARARDSFEKGFSLNPESLEALNSLSQFYCCCEDQAFRDYARAWDLATKCCKLTEWKDPIFLSALSTVHAQAGNFEEAVKWQREALRMNPASERQKMEQRLAMYLRQEAPFPASQKQSDTTLNR